MDISGDITVVIRNILDVMKSSMTFSLLLGFLALYCLVLFANVVLLFVLRSVSGDLKKGFFGTKEHSLTAGKSLLKEWKAIEARLVSGNSAECKVAILEADAFADRALSEMGYDGGDAGERFQSIAPGHFSGLPGLLEAHEIRNRIVHDSGFRIDRDESARVLALYRNILEEAEVFS